MTVFYQGSHMCIDKAFIPVLCFVGASNSGKTTLIEKVIRLLTVRGYKIATVKHTHKGFEMDTEGKDSWRHRSAGAKTVILSSATQFVVISKTDHELTIEDIMERFVRDVDILIVEGFKRDRYPKIEVHRGGVSGDLRCLNDPSIIALASDRTTHASHGYTSRPFGGPSEPAATSDLNIPMFDINDAEGVSNLIEQRFLRQGVYNNNNGGISND